MNWIFLFSVLLVCVHTLEGQGYDYNRPDKPFTSETGSKTGLPDFDSKSPGSESQRFPSGLSGSSPGYPASQQTSGGPSTARYPGSQGSTFTSDTFGAGYPQGPSSPSGFQTSPTARYPGLQGSTFPLDISKAGYPKELSPSPGFQTPSTATYPEPQPDGRYPESQQFPSSSPGSFSGYPGPQQTSGRPGQAPSSEFPIGTISAKYPQRPSPSDLQTPSAARYPSSSPGLQTPGPSSPPSSLEYPSGSQTPKYPGPQTAPEYPGYPTPSGPISGYPASPSSQAQHAQRFPPLSRIPGTDIQPTGQIGQPTPQKTLTRPGFTRPSQFSRPLNISNQGYPQKPSSRYPGLQDTPNAGYPQGPSLSPGLQTPSPRYPASQGPSLPPSSLGYPTGSQTPTYPEFQVQSEYPGYPTPSSPVSGYPTSPLSQFQDTKRFPPLSRIPGTDIQPTVQPGPQKISTSTQPGFTRPGQFSKPGEETGDFPQVPSRTQIDSRPGQEQFSGSDDAGQYREGPEDGDYSAIPGEPDVDYPILSYIPETSFKCDQQQYPGYYADVETRCQVFHICANSKMYDFLCPNGTVFHQEYLVCVWWNQFDCNSAPSLYEINAHIYDYSYRALESIPGQPGFPNAPIISGLAGEDGTGYPTGSGPEVGGTRFAPSIGSQQPGYTDNRPQSTGSQQPGYPRTRPQNLTSGIGFQAPSTGSQPDYSANTPQDESNTGSQKFGYPGSRSQDLTPGYGSQPSGYPSSKPQGVIPSQTPLGYPERVAPESEGPLPGYPQLDRQSPGGRYTSPGTSAPRPSTGYSQRPGASTSYPGTKPQEFSTGLTGYPSVRPQGGAPTSYPEGVTPGSVPIRPQGPTPSFPQLDKQTPGGSYPSSRPSGYPSDRPQAQRKPDIQAERPDNYPGQPSDVSQPTALNGYPSSHSPPGYPSSKPSVPFPSGQENRQYLPPVRK